MMNDFENQLDKIRVEIYEQTRELKNAEAVKAANEHGKALAVKYGIKIVKGNPGSPVKNASAV